MKFTKAQLANLVDEPYFSRGTSYFAEGLVKLISIKKDKVTAKCTGTRLYTTYLYEKEDQLSGHCSCPAFLDFGPCKHIAAVGLALIAHNQNSYKPSEGYEYRAEIFEKIEKILMRKSKKELVALVMQIANGEDELLYWLDEELEGI